MHSIYIYIYIHIYIYIYIYMTHMKEKSDRRPGSFDGNLGTMVSSRSSHSKMGMSENVGLIFPMK